MVYVNHMKLTTPPDFVNSTCMANVNFSIYNVSRVHFKKIHIFFKFLHSKKITSHTFHYKPAGPHNAMSWVVQLAYNPL